VPQFVLFVLLNFVLLLRPGDMVPELERWPIYLALLLLTCVAALPRLLENGGPHWLFQHPTTWCVLGVQVAIWLSHVSAGRTYEARASSIEFAKVLLYFFLVLLVLDTPERVRSFLNWLVLLIGALTLLAILQFFGVVQLLPQSTLLEQREFDPATGEAVLIPRLRAIGLFSDPNDLCLLLVVGMAICLWGLGGGPGGAFRVIYLGLLGLFGCALVLSQSRGGLLAVLAAAGLFVWLRWGWRKTALVAVVALPVVLVLVGGRMARLSAGEETAQERINLWSEALLMLRQSPLFGIGSGQFSEEMGLVAHNSYVHCFAELGFVGGTCFLGAFVLCLRSLYQLASGREQDGDPELRRLGLYVLCMVFGYGVGLLSLSRAYVVPTYLVLGLGVVQSQFAYQAGAAPRLAVSGRLMIGLTSISMLFLIGTYLFVRVALARMS